MTDNATTQDRHRLDIEATMDLSELAPALSKCQGAIEAARRDGQNPHFRSTFATLHAVVEACKQPLADNGLSILQLAVDRGPDAMGLTTMLMHGSGQWIRSTMVLPVEAGRGTTKAQAVGSTLTYMRRYALMAILNIPTEDDDGNDAGPRVEGGTKGLKKRVAHHNQARDNVARGADLAKQRAEVMDMLAQLKDGDEEKIQDAVIAIEERAGCLFDALNAGHLRAIKDRLLVQLGEKR